MLQANITVRNNAPDISGWAAEQNRFGLRGYLGRHRVLVIFVDDLKTDRPLLNLRDYFEVIDQADVKIVAVSVALPSQNRTTIQETGSFPFPVVSDPDLKIHRNWGRLDEKDQPETGLFVIDRTGRVEFLDGKPNPKNDVHDTLQELKIDIHPIRENHERGKRHR